MSIFTKKILDSMTSSGSKSPVGIHIGGQVSSIEIGENYIDFNYEDSTGGKANKRVWFPDMSKQTPRDGKTIQEAFADAEERAVVDIIMHLRVFANDEQIEASFSEFASVKDAAVKVKAAIDSKLSTEKINFKMVPDKTGKYSEVARYGYLEKYTSPDKTGLYYSEYEKKQIAGSSSGVSDKSSAPGESTDNLV